MKKIFAFAVLLSVALSFNGQITLNSALTPQQVVETLLGSGVEVTNVTFSGPANGLGTFTGNAVNFGMTNGVILANGSVNNALGPNTSGSSSLGGGNFGATDPDIDLLDPNYNHNDAAILEFDFIATGDLLSFNYIWASEEYPEFTGALGNCGDVSDAFGFFISGPGITGPFSNNAANIALIPGSTQFVSINNLNAGCNGTALPGAADCNFCQYYIHNGNGGQSPYNSSTQYLQYDGFTTVLVALANLICGETYHIKLVVADASDTAWDSAVFLEAGSFSVSLTVEVSPIIEPVEQLGNGQMIEGCVGGQLEMKPPCQFNEQVVTLNYGGTATPGVDYTFGGITQITLSPGVSVYLDIYPLDDNVNDPNETIIVSFDYLDFNGDPQTGSAQITIIQPQPLVLNLPDVVRCEGSTININATPTGGFTPYTYTWSSSANTAAIEGISTYGTITVSVSDYCNDSTSDSFVVSPPAPLLVNITNDQVFVCPDGVATATAVASAGAPPYQYTWTGSNSVQSTASFDILDLGMQYVNALDACGQTAIDSVQITTSTPLVPVQDLELCLNVATGSLATGGVPPYSYDYDGEAFQFNVESILTPVQTGAFTVSVTDGCNVEVDIPVVVVICDTTIPNIFTPNGDGKNDLFEIKGILDFPNSKLTVYNRWGNKVFESSNYRNNWSASDTEDGVYYIIVERSDKKNFEGYVHIVRK